MAGFSLPPLFFGQDIQSQGVNPSTDFSSAIGPAAFSSLYQNQSPGLQTSFLRQPLPGPVQAPQADPIGGLIDPVNTQSPTPGPLQQATPSLLGSLGGFLSAGAPAAAAPLAIQTGVNTLSGLPKLFSGDKLNTKEEFALALPTFGASFLADPVRDLFGGGKNPREKQRDNVRGLFSSVLGEDRTFDGINGSRLKLGDTENEAGIADDLLSQSVALSDPIAEAIAHKLKEAGAGESIEELRQDASSMIANAIGAGAANEKEASQNLVNLVKKFGLSPEDVRKGIAKSAKEGLIDKSRFEVYAMNLGKLTGLGAKEERKRIEALING